LLTLLLLLLLLLLCRFLRYDDPGSPILSERRSARSVQRKTIDASQYVDPDEMDFEGQEWLMPENAEPKPEKVNIVCCLNNSMNCGSGFVVTLLGGGLASARRLTPASMLTRTKWTSKGKSGLCLKTQSPNLKR
jgi:hypothetical protein